MTASANTSFAAVPMSGEDVPTQQCNDDERRGDAEPSPGQLTVDGRRFNRSNCLVRFAYPICLASLTERRPNTLAQLERSPFVERGGSNVVLQGLQLVVGLGANRTLLQMLFDLQAADQIQLTVHVTVEELL